MRYLKNYIPKFSQYYYKIVYNETIGYNETELSMFYANLSYPINSIINEKYIAWLEKSRCYWYSWNKNISFKKMG